ncbi:RNA polymerase sigma factor [Chitinophaga lutea]|uniref:RNA polymerase sigma factor n=1 Tax=Chitinophaga lutea TaxID=2488634 RepID=UPI0013154C0A|nr:RNA polymerase sigma-70 factor [Chitinophaga lutea]
MENKRLSEISKRIENDDEKAFREIFDLFYFDLLAFSRPIVADEQAAEDVVENVFLRLWQNRKTLGNINNLSAYLYTATKYASINYLKARKNTCDVAIEELDDRSLYNFSTPESSMIGKENVLSIERAINQLPPKSKLVFYLVKEKGLNCREVAKILNTSVRTVETQLYHSLKKIASLLEESQVIQPRRSTR